MEKIEKRLQLLMWSVVALLVILMFATIMLGHATDFGFFFSFQNVTDLGITTALNNSLIG